MHETKLSKPANQQTLGVSSSHHHAAVRQSSLPSQLLPRRVEMGGGRVNLAHENSSDEDSADSNEKDAMLQAQQGTRRKSSGSSRNVHASTHISSTPSLQQVYIPLFGFQ